MGLSHKLAKKFKGPYEVIAVWPSNLRLQLIENPEKYPIVIHANRCKKAPNTRVTQREVRNYPLRIRFQ